MAIQFIQYGLWHKLYKIGRQDGNKYDYRESWCIIDQYNPSDMMEGTNWYKNVGQHDNM